MDTAFLFTKNKYNIEYHGCSIHKDFTPDYTTLELLPYILKNINKKQKLLNNDYIAVHIRRTDHIQLAKDNNKYTTDTDFTNFIDSYPNKYLYIATDNLQTYKYYKHKYSDKVLLN